MAWREECGVFGIWNHPDATHLTYLGLYAMQHRGQEAAGIVTLDQKGQHQHHKGLGLVSEVFDEGALKELRGYAALGHVRYSTTGANHISNAQPFAVELSNGPVAIAHNGNIVNAAILKKELMSTGAIFQGTSDTEIVVHMVARHQSDNFVECMKHTLDRLEGAFSMGGLSHTSLVMARDPYGFRPLVLGELKHSEGVATVIASETCAFDLIGAKFVREIEPGELWWIDKDGQHSDRLTAQRERKSCIFEHVYFARPDSVVFGESVYESRKRAGAQLALEYPTDADVIVPVPDSGVPSALGFSRQSGIPFELGIIRNHYIGRTFIQPHQSIRDFGVKIKLNPQSAVLQGKRVVIIDDSLVRGTTSRKIVGLVRAAGSKEVHLRIAAPPTMGPCYYGVDTPQKSELIASHQSLEEIRNYVGADSLHYLSIEGLKRAVRGEKGGFCAACFDGKYPTELFGLEKVVKTPNNN